MINSNSFLGFFFFFLVFMPDFVTAKEFNVEIQIAAQQEQSLKIDYYFEHSVNSVSLANNLYNFRQNNWKVITPNVSLSYVNGKQYFIADKPVEHISIEINELNNEFILRQYTPFLTFSDNSFAAYIGHYLLTGLTSESNIVTNENINIHLKLISNHYKHVIYQNVVAESVDTRINGEQGYAYFGQLKPNNTNEFVSVVDPALPKWMKQSLDKYLPEVFNYFEKKFGVKLASKPLFIMNFTPSDKVHRSDGGVVNNQIAINIIGHGWEQNPENNKINFLKLIFHEIAHLWNSNMYQFSSDSGFWMHEGSANTFAIRALYDLGLITKKELLDHYNKALDVCKAALAISSIRKFPINGLSTATYSCGDIISLLVETAISKDDKNIFDFWGKIFKNAKNSTYSTEDYFSVLSDFNVTLSITNTIKSIVYGENMSLNQQLMDEFKRSDLVFLSKANNDNAEKIGMLTLTSLMRANCQIYSYWTKEEYFSTDKIPNCGVFDKKHLITGIGGFSLISDGYNAYKYLYKQCLNSGNVEINLYKSNEVILTKCKEPISRPIEQLGIQNIPFLFN